MMSFSVEERLISLEMRSRAALDNMINMPSLSVTDYDQQLFNGRRGSYMGEDTDNQTPL